MPKLPAQLRHAARDANTLDEIVTTITQLDDPTEVELDYALRILAGVVRLRRYLATVERNLSTYCGTQLDKGVHTGDGYVCEPQWSSGSYKYEHLDQLIAKVADQARDERRVNRDGEIEGEGEAVARVLAECFRFEPRRTPLKPRVNLDEFSEKPEGRWTVRWHSEPTDILEPFQNREETS